MSEPPLACPRAHGRCNQGDRRLRGGLRLPEGARALLEESTEALVE
ncbi:MAG: hypothetical protein WAL59_30170 [Roseiarcus sp.]